MPTVEAAVESEPAEPKDEYAESASRYVMTENSSGLAVFIIFSDTRSEDCGTDKAQTPPTICTAVEPAKSWNSELRQPAAAPNPVTRNRVDDAVI